MKIVASVRCVLLYASSLAVLSAAAPVDSLVGYWALDAKSGALAPDSSGNNETGTLIGGPIRSAGKRNGALTFNGTSQYVSVPSTSALDFGNTTSFSFGGWFQTGSASFGHLLADRGLKGQAGSRLVILTTGQVQARIFDGRHQIVSAASLPKNDGRWHHAMAVCDRLAKRLHLYIDGIEVGSAADISAVGSVTSGAAQFDFGANSTPGVPGQFFRGSLDEIRVYHRALSPVEVTEVMNDPGLTASAPSSAPAITAFSANPLSISVGQSATLSWTVANATSVTISNGPGAQASLASGSVKVFPARPPRTF